MATGVMDDHDAGRIRPQVDDRNRFLRKWGSKGTAVEDSGVNRTSWEDSHWTAGYRETANKINC